MTAKITREELAFIEECRQAAAQFRAAVRGSQVGAAAGVATPASGGGAPSPGFLERMSVPLGVDDQGRKFRVNRMSFELWLRDVDALVASRGGELVSARTDLPLARWYEEDRTPDQVLGELNPRPVMLFVSVLAKTGERTVALGHLGRDQDDLPVPLQRFEVTRVRAEGAVALAVVSEGPAARRDRTQEDDALDDRGQQAFFDWLHVYVDDDDAAGVPLVRAFAGFYERGLTPEHALDEVVARGLAPFERTVLLALETTKAGTVYAFAPTPTSGGSALSRGAKLDLLSTTGVTGARLLVLAEV
jgi:hypothetical protein